MIWNPFLWNPFIIWIRQRIKPQAKPTTLSLASGILSDLTRSRSDLIAENALLRQQLIVLHRQVKRPLLTRRNRFHLVLLSPVGYREPNQIHRIVREKARVRGAMASIVEWQSLRMQEYRYELLVAIACFYELFGVRRPVRYEKPAFAGDYDHALHVDHPDAPSFLDQYIEKPSPRLGGAPKQTDPGNETIT